MFRGKVKLLLPVKFTSLYAIGGIEAGMEVYVGSP